MTDGCWEVVRETLRRYRGVDPSPSDRAAVERVCRSVPFPGGVFLLNGCNVDVFVEPARRGRWATRKLLDQVLGGLIREHGMARCGIHPDNAVSLRFARRLGFHEVSRTDSAVWLEMKEWAWKS